jgi:hypothetical protein
MHIVVFLFFLPMPGVAAAAMSGKVHPNEKDKKQYEKPIFSNPIHFLAPFPALWLYMRSYLSVTWGKFEIRRRGRKMTPFSSNPCVLPSFWHTGTGLSQRYPCNSGNRSNASFLHGWCTNFLSLPPYRIQDLLPSLSPPFILNKLIHQ